MFVQSCLVLVVPVIAFIQVADVCFNWGRLTGVNYWNQCCPPMTHSARRLSARVVFGVTDNSIHHTYHDITKSATRQCFVCVINTNVQDRISLVVCGFVLTSRLIG